MIAEPYICIKGEPKSLRGQIKWFGIDPDGTLWNENGRLVNSDYWQPYADFEREKLSELGTYIRVLDGTAFCMVIGEKEYHSFKLIDYWTSEYEKDTESNRLLKRAEFLKVVCEKECLEWLPESPKAEECLPCRCKKSNLFHGVDLSDPPCDCHKSKAEESKKQPCWKNPTKNIRVDKSPSCMVCGCHKPEEKECKKCARQKRIIEEWTKLYEGKPEEKAEESGYILPPYAPKDVQDRMRKAIEEHHKHESQHFHIAKADDPTRTCVECGHVEKPEEKPYTRKQLDNLLDGILNEMMKSWDEEREWRKALLDVVEKELVDAMRIPSENIGLVSISDLRKRFL
jgi:hypothetical protein